MDLLPQWLGRPAARSASLSSWPACAPHVRVACLFRAEAGRKTRCSTSGGWVDGTVNSNSRRRAVMLRFEEHTPSAHSPHSFHTFCKRGPVIYVEQGPPAAHSLCGAAPFRRDSVQVNAPTPLQPPPPPPPPPPPASKARASRPPQLALASPRVRRASSLSAAGRGKGGARARPTP